MDARAPYAWQAVVQRALAMGPQRQARHDADWVEAKHPRGQPENAGQFAPKPGGASRSPHAPKPSAAPAPSPAPSASPAPKRKYDYSTGRSGALTSITIPGLTEEVGTKLVEQLKRFTSRFVGFNEGTVSLSANRAEAARIIDALDQANARAPVAPPEPPKERPPPQQVEEEKTTQAPARRPSLVIPGRVREGEVRRINGVLMKITSVSSPIDIDEDTASSLGSHLLGHEGERAHRVSYRQATAEEATTWDKANDPTMNTRFPGVAPSAEAPPMPKLPEFTKGPEAKEIHKELKRLAAQIDKVNAAYPPNTGDWREQARVETLERIPMSDLVRARRDLWARSSVNTNKLTKGDQALYDTIHGEIQRRLETDKKERDERAHRYAYMSVEEFNDHIGAIGFLGGDSHMMPGIKAQLGMLPPRHLRALRNQGMKIRAMQEIAPLSMDHPYAPGMQPAGLFHPGTGLVEVADQVSLPDGSKRQLYSRTQTLRHEVGHAIDNITEVSFDPDLAQAIYDGIKRMTPLEHGMAAYYLGEGAKDDATRLNARRLETFAELYAYAYSEGASDINENGTFGGMSASRRFELFGRAKDILRQKVAAYFNDRRLDSVREAA